jgi:hypothetical protein
VIFRRAGLPCHSLAGLVLHLTMKFLSVLPLLSLISTTIHALPNTEFEIIGTRGWYEVPIQIRADVGNSPFETREIKFIRIETRGDGNGRQLSKAGSILDKVDIGLSVASAAANAVPVLGQIESVSLCT